MNAYVDCQNALSRCEIEMRSLRAMVQTLVVALLWTCAPALSQTIAQVHDQIRPSLVYIEMKGRESTGLPVGSAGTGFFVSEDGFILTSYHLLAEMSKAIPATIEVWVYFDVPKPNPDRKGFVIDAREHLDLLLLKVPRSQSAYPAVHTGAARRLDGATVLISGFRSDNSAADVAYERFQDQIINYDGPGPYWTLQGRVAAGQSGSPVYTTNGTVIGVVKGLLNDRTVFVPIEHAVTLLNPFSADPKGERK